MKQGFVRDDDILNTVNETETLNNEERTTGDLKRDSPDEIDKSEETLKNHIPDTYLNNSKTETHVSGNVWVRN